MAESYLAGKDPEDATTISALEDLAGRLPEEATVLDLGCGAGVPATRWLSERFDVTGVDISEKQISLARENAPGARFVRSDMTDFDAAPESFNAVVALLSIIHVPREEQASLFGKIYTWLKAGGYFFAVLSVGAWEGFDPDWESWGAGMWWSHYDAATNLASLRSAGFRIESSEEKTVAGTGSDEETWLYVIAQKSPGFRHAQ